VTEVNIEVNGDYQWDKHTIIRKYFTKIVNGRMIHADAEGDDAVKIS